MATSWGTRKALGRRYGMDPAVLMEAQRLQEEYGLMPGREARALQAAQMATQASQFQQSLGQQDKALAQNQSQFDATQEGNKQAGMVGAATNLATTGALVRGMTMKPGEAFFANPFAAAPTTTAVTTPTLGASYGAAAPTSTFGTTPFTVNPALMTEASAASGVGGPAAGTAATGTAATGTAAETGMLGTVAPYAAPVAAGYFGPKIVESAMPGASENLGHNLSFGLLKGEKDATTLGKTASGAAAGAAIGSIVPGVGTVVGGVVGAVTGFISSVFGW